MQVEVSKLIDEGRWSGYQKLLIGCTALAIILDGIDNQLLGTAIPTMAKEWLLTRNDFSTALAMSPLGMLAGGALGGWLGDRVGRRLALLTSVLAFALPTILIYFVNGVEALGALRFLAGLGLGGAMPNATALASEYVPRRHRPFAVTLTIVCVPVGATLAAESSAHVIPLLGWRVFFLLGGLIPVLLGAILFVILPESPRFLASRRQRWPELRVLLHKIGIHVPADAQFEEQRQAPAAVRPAGAGKVEEEVDFEGIGVVSKRPNAVAALFAPALRRDTLALFGSFFAGLLVAYLSLQLLVTALVSAGFSEFDARRTLFWWNVGGVGGALAGALVIQRLGSRKTMLGLSALAIASCIALAGLPLAKTSPPAAVHSATAAVGTAPAHAAAAPAAPKPRLSLASPVGLAMILLSVLMGAAVNAVQVAMYALAAHVYPTEIRGTGLGVTVAVGRVGNVMASYIGNYALNLGISAYFAASGIGMVLVFLSLALVRGHIERHVAAANVSSTKAPAET